ncbi:hypothetical protein Tco_1342580 [Tanacetum coccineum]
MLIMTKASFVENGFKHNKIDESQVGVHYNEDSIMDFDKVYGETEKSSESESNVSCKVDVDGMDLVEINKNGNKDEEMALQDSSKVEDGNTCFVGFNEIVHESEIDVVGRQRRAGLGCGNDEREQTLNELLTEMDDFFGDTVCCQRTQ